MIDDEPETIGHTISFLDRMMSIWDNDLAVRSHHNGRPAVAKIAPVGYRIEPPSPAEVWSQGEVRVISGQVRHEPVEGAVGYRIETPDGVVVISGDTRVCDELAAGADVLVYEAMRFDLVFQRPSNWHFVMDYHADTRLIGVQAQELNIPTVMSTHLAPGPKTDAERDAFGTYLREGGYTGTVVVCDDLSSVTVAR